MKRKFIYAGFAALFTFICILILLLFKENPFIRGSIGDFVFVMLMYFSGMIFLSLKPETLAFSVLGIAFAAEFSQFIRLLDLIGMQENRFLKILLGATFDPFDLLAYVLGVSLAFTFDKKIIRTFADS